MQIHSAKDIGRAVRAKRKHLRMTQSEVALVAACGVRFIVDVEAGKPTLRLDTLLRVIDVLGGTLTLEGMSPGGVEGPDHA